MSSKPNEVGIISYVPFECLEEGGVDIGGCAPSQLRSCVCLNQHLKIFEGASTHNYFFDYNYLELNWSFHRIYLFRNS